MGLCDHENILSILISAMNQIGVISEILILDSLNFVMIIRWALPKCLAGWKGLINEIWGWLFLDQLMTFWGFNFKNFD